MDDDKATEQPGRPRTTSWSNSRSGPNARGAEGRRQGAIEDEGRGGGPPKDGRAEVTGLNLDLGTRTVSRPTRLQTRRGGERFKPPAHTLVENKRNGNEETKEGANNCRVLSHTLFRPFAVRVETSCWVSLGGGGRAVVGR